MPTHAITELSPELIKAVEALEGLADEELWQLARMTMSREASQELEALHLKQRDDGLSEVEDAARAKLIQEYEQTMLIRAQAAKLLKDRGHDVSTLLGTRRERQFGSAKGFVEIADDFDAPWRSSGTTCDHRPVSCLAKYQLPVPLFPR